MNKLLSGTFFLGILLAFCAGTSVAASDDKNKDTDDTVATGQKKHGKQAAHKSFRQHQRQRQHAKHVIHANPAVLNNRRFNRAGE